MLIVKASMTGDDLKTKNPDGAEINVKLMGNRLEGNLKSNQTSLPVVFTKQP